MACFTIEMYNKDDDFYSDSYTCRTEEEARAIAECLSTLIKKDMIVDRYNGRQEPFDWVEVYKNEMIEGKLIQECILKI